MYPSPPDITSMDSTLGLESPDWPSPADMASPPCPANIKSSVVSPLFVSQVSPGTETKNLTASLWPWNDSWAWDIEQKGVKVPGTTRSPESA